MKPYDRLLEHNIKPSMQRIAIMEYLMEHPIHPSADDIYTALSPSMPTLSKTTVYNTLKLFSEQGAALMLPISFANVADIFMTWNVRKRLNKWKIWKWMVIRYRKFIIIIKVFARIA